MVKPTSRGGPTTGECDLNKRPHLGGSMHPSFNPTFAENTGLNKKLGPRWPRLTQTSAGGALGDPDYKDRRATIGLPPRLKGR
jgi:hypothetical protein